MKQASEHNVIQRFVRIIQVKRGFAIPIYNTQEFECQTFK